jgi:2-amino-4-hydroxy-6-hydroxymethyldihydropteridine diphosphokinase
VRVAYLSLGSNLGDRRAHLVAAVQIVADGDAHRVSSLYLTEPWGPVAQDDYYNVVVEVTTEATAHELLERCRRAETARGRERAERFGPRTLDADVLLVGDEVVSDPDLLVPHPRMWERRFVLVPLYELAPALVSEDLLERADGRVELIGTLNALG